MIAVAENKYGKSRVRLVKVQRNNGWHELREWTVEILLQGDFARTKAHYSRVQNRPLADKLNRRQPDLPNGFGRPGKSAEVLHPLLRPNEPWRDLQLHPPHQ